jgi:hypothetical protein
MLEVDEFSQGPTQKDTGGALWQIPLRKFQFATGWTKDYEEEAPASEFAIKNQAAQGADSRRTRYEILRAIFNPTNYSFVDLFKDKATIAVKAFINADGAAIPNGPNAEVFDGSTHTHYNASPRRSPRPRSRRRSTTSPSTGTAPSSASTSTRTDAASFSGAVRASSRSSSPNITIGMRTATARDAAPRHDAPRQPADRLVQRRRRLVKPWVPQNYLAAIDIGAPQKPLRRRVKTNDRGLHIAGEVDVHPLRAQYIERYQGFGALNRLAVAVLKFNNATYSAPALTY